MNNTATPATGSELRREMTATLAAIDEFLRVAIHTEGGDWSEFNSEAIRLRERIATVLTKASR